jgi:hypothetical protein
MLKEMFQFGSGLIQNQCPERICVGLGPFVATTENLMQPAATYKLPFY